MKAPLLLALALVACGNSHALESSDDACDLPYIGEFVAPALLPDGTEAACYEVVSGSSAIVLLERDAPSCGSTSMGECVADGCTTIFMRPNAIVDAWGDSASSPYVAMFNPRPASDCN